MPEEFVKSQDRRATGRVQADIVQPTGRLWPSAKAAFLWAAGLALYAAASFMAPAAQAADDDALKILKGMSDYLASQKSIWLSFNSDIEVITSEIQKIQFASSGQVLLSRPDKLRATRTGGYADVEFVFDGKTASVLGKNMNAFVQLEAPGSVEQLSTS